MIRIISCGLDAGEYGACGSARGGGIGNGFGIGDVRDRSTPGTAVSAPSRLTLCRGRANGHGSMGYGFWRDLTLGDHMLFDPEVLR